MKNRIRLRRIAAGVTTLAVVLGTAHAPANAGPRTGLNHPGVAAEKPRPVRLAPPAAPLGRDTFQQRRSSSLRPVAWPAPAAADIPVGSQGGARAEVRVGGLPVTLTSAGRSAAAGTIRVETLGQEVAAQANVHGVVVRATGPADRTAHLTFGYEAFRYAAGGDFGGRLRLYRMPECGLRGPAAGCAVAPLPTRNDTEARSVTAEVQFGAAPVLLVLAAAGASGQGAYGATALSPSSQWNVSPGTGGFTWSYPMRAPATPGGLGPDLSFSYSSQVTDGRTAMTNNQGSWVGEGFTYEPGYVERRYRACADDGHKEKGDMCWARDNAVVSLNGRSSEIIKVDDTDRKDPSGFTVDSTWRYGNDDGSRIERLVSLTNGDDNGEGWKVTTTDGRQYFYGIGQLPGWSKGKETTDSTWTVPVFGDDAGEPCHDADYAKAHCQQGWRWNLDMVKDRHGNVMTLYYGRESNTYALNAKYDKEGVRYDRGGHLKRIDYGQRDGKIFTANAPARVQFEVAERCVPDAKFACKEEDLTKANQARWPDVPFDLICPTGKKCTVGQTSPTFFSRKRLTAVTTEVRTGNAWKPVESWRLEQGFLDNADGSLSLWPYKIQHVGQFGADKPLAMPPVTLVPSLLDNRIDLPDDGVAGMARARLATVLTDTGAQIDVNYAKPDCAPGNLPTPGTSTKRCFPVIWDPKGTGTESPDWFHKYVVEEVVERDRTRVAPDVKLSPPMVTRYEYHGAAAWRHSHKDGITEPKFQTWSEWRGYEEVSVRTGGVNDLRTHTRYTFLRGMHDDMKPGGGTRPAEVENSEGGKQVDHDELAGFEFETRVFAGDRMVSKTLAIPFRYRTAVDKNWKESGSHFVKPQSVRSLTPLTGGKVRETASTTTYDTGGAWPTGRTLRVDNAGDKAVKGDEVCIRTEYADNGALHLLDLVRRVETVSVPCATEPRRPDDVLTDKVVFYDGASRRVDAPAPTRGLETRTQQLRDYVNAAPQYTDTATGTFDPYGRPLTVTDAGGSTTRLEYTETEGLTTGKVEISPKVDVAGKPTEFRNVTEYSIAWGTPTVETDWNGRPSRMTYDALGRLTAVALQGRPITDPDVKYSYLVRDNAPVVVRADKWVDRRWQSEFQFYDGFMRPRQLQAPGPDGNRLVSEIWYTATGKPATQHDPFLAKGAAADEMIATPGEQLGKRTAYEYDEQDRVTATIQLVGNVAKWRTTTSYEGDRTHVTPPTGGTAATSITDAAGRVVELRQYRGGRPEGVFDATTYGYDNAGRLTTIKDSAGNTWRNRYDRQGRRIGAVDPDAGESTFTYDAADRLLTATDARGVTLRSEYDALGRKVASYRKNGDKETKLAAWTYDVADRGQLDSAIRYVDGQEYRTTTLSRDAHYRPTKTRQVVPEHAGKELAGQYDFITQYDADGAVRTSNLPAAGGLPAEVLSFEYDDLRRLKKIQGKRAALLTDATYLSTGELLQAQVKSGSRRIWTTYTYDDTKRVDTFRLTREAYTTGDNPTPDRPTSDILQKFGYDDMGNVLSIADTPGTKVNDIQCFRYDHLRRMTDTWTTDKPADDPCAGGPERTGVAGPAPYHHSYAYDETGNRTREVIHGVGGEKTVERTYAYPDPGKPRPHALTWVTESGERGDRRYSYEYNDAGAVTKRVRVGEEQKIDWDVEGRVAAVTEKGKTTEFLYDADGARILRREADSTTLYVGPMELQLNRKTGAVAGTRYTPLAGGATLVETVAGKQIQVSDHHGTGQAAISTTRNDIAIRRSTPFGTPRGSQPDAMGWFGDKGFVGGTKDPSTGLTELGARQYEPTTGRFMSVDPIIDVFDPQQMNGYAYANNSPASFSDPDGLKACSDDRCGPGADYVDKDGKYHHVAGHNDGCGGCSNAKDPTSNWSGSGSNVHYVPPVSADVLRARQRAAENKRQLIAVGKHLGKILAKELGITDALDCVTKGDIGACVATGINIITSAIGGAIGKLVVKYGLRWKALAQVVKTVKNLGAQLIDLVGEFFQTRKALRAAEASFERYTKLTDGGSCVSNSFVPGTLVLMADGSKKPIEKVKTGDRVRASDPERGRAGSREVVATIVGHGAKRLVTLTIDVDGSRGDRTEKIVATAGHPFWVASRQQWMAASELKADMTLQSLRGGDVRILAARVATVAATVHNLTVADIHTYHVLAGNTPVLVHNCGGGFKKEVSADEIDDINRSVGGVTELNGSASNALANAARYNSFWEKSAVMIRDIAGSHMYNDGNKRTAHTVVSELMKRNNVISGPNSNELWSVIGKVANANAKGHTNDIGQIARMLRGY
ncbi:hypothetical protein GCM10010123_06980 [Pilimelia anulata]|uniref:Fido domain-containing protein n=1 Tax=Pilimelia anulata TaxID=53371 RepID=A0A8J3F7L4_9ACTN|nr:polymorphic toxin-type HINT domain-containing protein [Pilimelia anulata]GGJ79792.1 hypothetical protein GCM10010123_06980 [Pilimelia anulata]